jgi:protein-tyrosine phosphatase
MAAEYFRHRAARSRLSHVVVDSGGVLGIEGSPASDGAIAVLKEDGLDLSNHRSKGLDRADLRTSDVVVAMSLDHLDALERLQPNGSQERYLIRAFEDGPVPLSGAPELEDPLGTDLETYRVRYRCIKTCMDHLVLYLRHEAR